MPDYEFECQQCGARFMLSETFQEHEQHHEQCPKCESLSIEPRLSPVYARTSKKS